MEFLQKLTDWEFLNEPLYRWFIFLGALLLIAWAWGAILSFMR